jgi:hypothetical protein
LEDLNHFGRFQPVLRIEGQFNSNSIRSPSPVHEEGVYYRRLRRSIRFLFQ